MDVMCGEPSLYIWDWHVEESYIRKGIGKHLLTLLELLARQQNMRMISVPVQLHDEAAASFMRAMRGSN